MPQPALFPEFDPERPWERLHAPGANVWLRRRFMTETGASRLLAHLIENVPWRRDTIEMFGKTHDVPARTSRWCWRSSI